MEDIQSSITEWFCFWATYWLAEGLIPASEESKKIKPSMSVPKTVFRNMMLTLPYAIILRYLSPDISALIPGSYITRLLIATLMADGWFYMAHRLLHHRRFYRFHKQHHEYNVPYPLVTVYSSSVEAIFCDATAVGLGPSLLKMTGLELEIWMMLIAIHVLFIHSALFHGKDHNEHHGKNNSNFGLFSVFDRIFGTYK